MDTPQRVTIFIQRQESSSSLIMLVKFDLLYIQGGNAWIAVKYNVCVGSTEQCMCPFCIYRGGTDKA